MTFETIRKFQELSTDLNFFVKYTNPYTPTETYGGNTGVSTKTARERSPV
jgi:hypothetical protein